jgi:hypothetical protein
MHVFLDVTMYHWASTFWCSEESYSLHFLGQAVQEQTWVWVQFCEKLFMWNYTMQISLSYLSYRATRQIRHGIQTPTVPMCILHVTFHHSKYHDCVTIEAWVRYQAGPCGICGGWSDTGPHFSLSTSVPPPPVSFHQSSIFNQSINQSVSHSFIHSFTTNTA